MKKEEFIKIVGDRAIKDAESSEDDFSAVSDKEEIRDIADDAWNHSAIPGLEYTFMDDPKSPYAKKGIDIHEAIEKYNLSKTYKDAFVKAVIKKFKLKL
jgi:hypothetical protein